MDVLMSAAAVREGPATGSTAGSASLGRGSRVDTSITIVPCTENFETQVPTTVTIQFLVYDEFESNFSASTSVTCWAELQLDEISNVFLPPPARAARSDVRRRRVCGRPPPPQSGFMVVAEADAQPVAQRTVCTRNGRRQRARRRRAARAGPDHHPSRSASVARSARRTRTMRGGRDDLPPRFRFQGRRRSCRSPGVSGARAQSPHPTLTARISAVYRVESRSARQGRAGGQVGSA